MAASSHWVLLLLAMVVVLSALVFSTYLNPDAGEGSGPRTAHLRSSTQPPDLDSAGPVLRIDGEGRVQSRSLPARSVALTFDDGPDPEWTPQILDVLARHGVHATFFVIGSKVNEEPELARRIVAEGHEIGAHTFTHREMASLPSWRRTLELNLTANAIAGATSRTAQLFRAPYSSRSGNVTGAEFDALRTVADAGYLAVFADNDTKDWRHPGVESIVESGTPANGAGAVVMMHDGGGDRSQTVAALDPLIARLSGLGYTFDTVSGALGLPEPSGATTLARWRGQALRWAQVVSVWLGHWLGLLLIASLALPVVRLGFLVVMASVHARRPRRRPNQLRYVAPVSVVVPAHNESANIAATVASIVGSNYPCLEVIVVDDGSDDGTADIVTGMALPNVRVLRQARAGKPAALNNGIAHAHFDLLVTVDGDTALEPDALTRLVQPFADATVGAVSGNTKVADRLSVLGSLQHLEYVISTNLERRMFDVAECMPTVPGAIGAFRRSAVQAVRGVSADTLAEDTDLTMAVVRAGWRVVYVPDAVAYTQTPDSMSSLWRQRYRWCYGVMQSMWKHRRSIVEPGAAGRLGRRGLAYLFVFQIALPLMAPLIDLYAIYGLLFLPWTHVPFVWLGALVAQAAAAAYALRLDRESLRALWALPWQQVIYRQLTYLVVVQSAVTALRGSRVRWHRAAVVRPHRSGALEVPRTSG